MENKINIAEILNDCPKVTNLYSPLYGEVKLKQVVSNAIRPIRITTNIGEETSFYSDGRDSAIYPEAECMFFPSRKMRDWTKFFKRGDVVIKNGGGMAAVFDGWANDTYTEFNTAINLYCDDNTGEEEVCDTLLFRKATEEERKQFIQKVEIRLKGKYNPETLKVEPVKPECSFMPFDKVLVRDNAETWRANFFSYYKKDDEFHYVCVSDRYRYCIPYEGNEHLLGTTDPYTEGGGE